MSAESLFRHVRLMLAAVTKSKGALSDALLAATQRRDVSRFRVRRGVLEMGRALATLRRLNELHDDRLLVVGDLANVNREQARGILGNLDLDAIEPELAVRLSEILHVVALDNLDVALAVDPRGEHLEPPDSRNRDSPSIAPGCHKVKAARVDVGNGIAHGDPIWEHKKGRIWQIVARQEREIRALRYQVKVLQARCRRA